jgi:hypothetical protein
MMKLLLKRIAKKEKYTIGKLYINGVYFSDTIEDKDRGLDQSMSEANILHLKVKHQTAIPTGTSEIKMTYSPKFANRAWAKKYSGKVVEITNVKAYSGVRIHPFNTAAESLGCIAVGRNLVKGKVLQSTIYYQKLVDDYISPALKRGEKVTITIK